MNDEPDDPVTAALRYPLGATSSLPVDHTGMPTYAPGVYKMLAEYDAERKANAPTNPRKREQPAPNWKAWT